MNADPPRKWRWAASKVADYFRSTDDRNRTVVLRKRRLVNFLKCRLTSLKITLFIVGYVWMLILPFPELGRSTYMDENALQPAQVNTNWDWGNVHEADRYLEQIERMRDNNITSNGRAQWFKSEFSKLGISSSTQIYSFSTSIGEFSGTNAYAVLASPRHSGTEALVISASWVSRSGEGDGTVNARGISTVLALASFLKRYSYWAKDIIFVVSDGYLEGMQAWLSAYHSHSQTTLTAQQLDLTSGVIWSALNIDYPGHSFSHIGVFFEALNGRLPNQDLINSLERIARYTAGVPVTLYDNLDPREEHPVDHSLNWLPPAIKTYLYQATNVIRHMRYQYNGRGSGVHGLFRKFRIDAITLFCIPATGPHGFHAIGRTVESTLRTMNNQLERLHASFFFYILTSPEKFLKIGLYLPSAILISIALMIQGLSAWVEAASTIPDVQEKTARIVQTSRRRKRPIIAVLSVVIGTHVVGVVLFAVVSSRWFLMNYEKLSFIVFATVTAVPFLFLALTSQASEHTAPTSAILKAANLCLASTTISIITVLNFSLSGTLTAVLGIPLILASLSPSKNRLLRYLPYAGLGIGWIFAHREIVDSIWSWQVLSVWFAPFICVVYVPLVLQAGIVSLLS